MIEYTVKVDANGDKEWYVNGQLHRTDGPAIECANGYKSWWINGQLHREDGHAIECANGYKSWWLNGQRHREEWKNKTSPQSCAGKVITIDGRQYRLTEI